MPVRYCFLRAGAKVVRSAVVIALAQPVAPATACHCIQFSEAAIQGFPTSTDYYP